MCDKDYVRHVINKYRLTIAISVIKTKPDHLTLDQYVELLRNKLTNENDDNASVTSQDFDLSGDIMTNSDSQETVAVSLDTDVTKNTLNLNVPNLHKDTNNLPNEEHENIVNIINFDTPSLNTNMESVDKVIIEENEVINTKSNSECMEVLNESIDLLGEYTSPVVGGENETENSQVVTDVLTILKSLDDEINDMRNRELPSNTLCTTQDTSTTNQVLQTNTIDSQSTIIYTYPNTENYTHVSQSQTPNIVIEKQYITSKNNIKYGGNIQDDQIIDNIENNEVIENGDDETMLEENDEDGMLVEESALQQTRAERIPFKIIEEMTRVRNVLNKRDRKLSTDGYSTDSGYRSDSQKSFRSSLQSSDSWLNQSGYSMLRHIAQSPLEASTHEINDEIAQVLGKLIDRLQDEEKCPTFLKEILENVDHLLKNIHEGSNSEEMTLTEKDENIHRLLLFNKSIHVQKYTISKITKILEKQHAKLTSTDSIAELENIDQIENLCYIFHVLQVLIQKYVKLKHYTQSSENTQTDEKFPKRSTITDIWRKKWNTVSKETIENEGSSQKVCVLKKCREILNKIIVDCMNGYSLVAYSALQCFNSLQN